MDPVPKLAMLAPTLENTAAATYVTRMGELASGEALSIHASTDHGVGRAEPGRSRA